MRLKCSKITLNVSNCKIEWRLKKKSLLDWEQQAKNTEIEYDLGVLMLIQF